MLEVVVIKAASGVTEVEGSLTDNEGRIFS